MYVSIVIPVLNEIDSLPQLTKELSNNLKGYDSWEVIFIDDGSTDGSTTWLIQYCASNCPTKQGIEKKKALQSSLQKDVEPSLHHRKFGMAKKIIKCLTRGPLLDRLRVLRSAWILGDGDVSQPWLECNGKKERKS